MGRDNPSNERRLPSGLVTFLFTDIEGSTRLFHELGGGYQAVLEEHRKVIREAAHARDGVEVKTEGDAFLIAFGRPADAIAAAVDLQLGLASNATTSGLVRVRAGIHTGHASPVEGDYVSLALHLTARILSAANGGQVLVSAETARESEPNLASGISLRPLGSFSLKDFPTPQTLFQVEHPGIRSDFRSPRIEPQLSHNLPTLRTSFFGRRDERRAVTEALRGSGLVTLVGPGGVGKTRLAIEVALDLVGEFSDGVWLIELDSLADPSSVASSVAGTIGVPAPGSGDWTANIVATLQPLRGLLVLDNCEHVIEGVADLVDVLSRSCRRLAVLVTSREALAVDGEVLVRVDPLPGTEALALFIDRARQAGVTLNTDRPTEQLLENLVASLDHLPLAIELVAARAGTTDLAALATAVGTRRSGPPRQRSLTAIVEWSWQQCDPSIQALMEKLSVFRGGASLKAAEAVGDELPGRSIADQLAVLVDKSLLVRDEAGGTARYRMLEIVRAFAASELSKSGEAETAGRRHLHWFLSWAEAVAPMLNGRDQGAALDAMADEHDNLREAFRFALSRGLPSAAFRLAAALRRYFEVRGHLQELHDWASTALETFEDADEVLRAAAWVDMANSGWRRGRYDSAELAADTAVELARRSGDTAVLADALGARATVAHFQGDFATAIGLYDKALEARRRLGDQAALARTLGNLGTTLWSIGDLKRGIEVVTEAADILRSEGNSSALCVRLSNLAYMALTQGDTAAATRSASEGLSIARQLGHREMIANHTGALGRAAICGGDVVAGSRLLVEALEMARDIGDENDCVYFAEELALAHLDTQPHESAMILAAAATLRAARKSTPDPPDQARREQATAVLRGRLAPNRYEEAIEEGRKLTLEELVEASLSRSDPPRTTTGASSARSDRTAP